MKWIKRLCSFIFLCILIIGGILTYQGYTDYRKALEAKSVEEMAAARRRSKDAAKACQEGPAAEAYRNVSPARENVR